MSTGSDPPPEQGSSDFAPRQYDLNEYLESEPEKPVKAKYKLDYFLALVELILSPSSVSSLGLIIILVLLIFICFLILNPFHVIEDKVQSMAAETLFKLVPTFLGGFFAGSKANQAKQAK